MKRLLLLSALLILACSSEEGNNDDNNTETFLERYDGVVWQYDTESADVPYFLAFYNNPEMFRRNNGIYENCDEFYFGIFNEEEDNGWGLLFNDTDTLILENFDFEGINQKIHTIIVVNDILTETVTSYEDGGFINEITCTRTTLTDPCE